VHAFHFGDRIRKLREIVVAPLERAPRCHAVDVRIRVGAQSRARLVQLAASAGEGGLIVTYRRVIEGDHGVVGLDDEIVHGGALLLAAMTPAQD
jgi:hypothetical protein